MTAVGTVTQHRCRNEKMVDKKEGLNLKQTP